MFGRVSPLPKSKKVRRGCPLTQRSASFYIYLKINL